MLRIRIAAYAVFSFVFLIFNSNAFAGPSLVTCFSGDRVIACDRPSIQIAPRHQSFRHSAKASVRRSNEAQTWSKEPVGSGIVVSHKTGATAHVSPAEAYKFQAYVNDLEAAGATVYFMGGYRAGPCWFGGLHPCGKALDVCQLARGIVAAKCHLPGKAVMAKIARNNNLFEGGQWCHSDYGHAQTIISAGPCHSNLYAAVNEYQIHSKRN